MSKGFVHERAVSQTHEWYTPAWIFEELGLEFDLDPCHPIERLLWVPAARRYTVLDNGLVQVWDGSVWLNPPYDPPEQPCKTKCDKKRCLERGHCVDEYVPGLVDWMAKMHEHGRGVALVFARTDTDWFARYVAEADGVLFLRRRVRFVGADGKPKPGKDGKVGSPGAGSMLVAWGLLEREALMAMAMRGLGTFADLR